MSCKRLNRRTLLGVPTLTIPGHRADFDAGVKRIFDGKSPDKIPVRVMWAGIGNQDAFYEDLPWTSDGKELWNAVKDLRPSILTGESSGEIEKVTIAASSRELTAKFRQKEFLGRRNIA